MILTEKEFSKFVEAAFDLTDLGGSGKHHRILAMDFY